MKSVSSPPRKTPRHPAQTRKGEAAGLDVSAEDLYAAFSAEGKALRPWDELPASQQKRWEAVAASLS